MAKSVAARTGGVRLYHRLRDREALTVIMLHRVLPKAMYAAHEPDPDYTISTEVLERLVRFLRANYTIVGLPELLEARRGTRSLPPRPLLITFDDGWDDNVLMRRQSWRRKERRGHCSSLPARSRRVRHGGRKPCCRPCAAAACRIGIYGIWPRPELARTWSLATIASWLC